MLYFTYSPAPFARVLSEKLIAISRAGKSLLMFGADCLALPLCLQLALLASAGTGAYISAPPALTLLLTAMSIAALAMSDLYSAVVRYLDQRMLTIAGLGLGGAVLAAGLIAVLAASNAKLGIAAIVLFGGVHGIASLRPSWSLSWSLSSLRMLACQPPMRHADHVVNAAPNSRISRVSIRVSTAPISAIRMLARQNVVEISPITAPWPWAPKRSAHQVGTMPL